MVILISGSLAYDYIMDFPGRFREHILPEKLHVLNLSFCVDKLERQFGGCAGNIAYNLRLLGGDPRIFGALGIDARPYLKHLQGQDISVGQIVLSEDCLTACAQIITDQDGNQIAAFYPGPWKLALELNFVPGALGIVAPTNKNVMLAHIRMFADQGVPVVFDPGQQTGNFTPDELRECLSLASFVIGNDYEIALICQKMKQSEKELVTGDRVLIKTLGAKGSSVTEGDEIIEVPAARVPNLADPTGAGDAYRAGFFWAYLQGKKLRECAEWASVAASFAIEKYGTQNHNFTPEEFSARHLENFGSF